MHLLLHCTRTVRIWQMFNLPLHLTQQFTLPFMDWLYTNLKNDTYNYCNMSWPLVYTATLWFIWQCRCNTEFQPTFRKPRYPAQHVQHYALNWATANGCLLQDMNKTPTIVKWTLPPSGFVKLNTDGSCTLDRQISCGDIRVAEGNWLLGYAKHIGYGSIRETESCGIF